MLKINETKINMFLDKNIKLKITYPIININSLLINYINSYIDFIKVKKILEYKTVYQRYFNIKDHINKKYKSVEFIKIGDGKYGSVFKINNNICVKIEEFPIFSLYENIMTKNNELKISIICGNKKISPKIFLNDIIYNEYNSNFYYYTYMKYIDGITLYNFLKYLPNYKTKIKIFKMFTKKKNILDKLGYIHNDLHLNNIILKVKNKKIIDLFIIDYGLSKNLKNMNINIVKKYSYNNDNENLIMYFIYKKYIEIDLKNIDKLLNIYKETSNINNINNIDYKNIIYNSKSLNNIFLNICKNKNETKIIETNDIMEYLEKKYIILDIINDDIYKYYFFGILSYNENKYYEELYKIIEVVKDGEKYLILLYKVYNFYYQINRTENINLIHIFSKKSIFHISEYEYIIDKYNAVFSLSFKIPNYLKIIDIKAYFEIDNIILSDKKNFLNKIRQLYKNMLKYSIKYSYSYDNMFFTLKNNKINKIYYINVYNTLDNYYKNNKNKFSNNQNIYFTNKLIENKIVIIK